MIKFFLSVLIKIFRILIKLFVIIIILYVLFETWGAIELYGRLISDVTPIEVREFSYLQRVLEKEQEFFKQNGRYCTFKEVNLFWISVEVIKKRNYYYVNDLPLIYIQKVLSKRKCIIHAIPNKYTGVPFFPIFYDKIRFRIVCYTWGLNVNRISYFAILDNGTCTVHAEDKHGNIADEQSMIIATFIPDDQVIPKFSEKIYHFYDNFIFRHPSLFIDPMYTASMLAGSINDESEFASRMAIK